MKQLQRCDCGGFLPTGASACPYCTRSRLKIVGLVGGVLGSGILGFTLMACYGAGCVDNQAGCGGDDYPDAGPTKTDAGGAD